MIICHDHEIEIFDWYVEYLQYIEPNDYESFHKLLLLEQSTPQLLNALTLNPKKR